MHEVKLLSWDTAFFCKTIGSLHITNDNVANVDLLLSKTRQEGYQLIYVFADSHLRIDDNLLSNYAGQLVDVKRTYNNPLLTTDNGKTNLAITTFGNSENRSRLYDLAFQSGECSRFRVDSRLGESEFRRFYREWIDNSLAGLLADKVFVYREHECIVGFITVKKKAQGSTIGLIATDRTFRGQGIGKALLKHTHNYVVQAGIRSINVVTQGRNEIACMFYEHNGFSLQEEINVYHCWL